ncbi:MAG: glycosyl hydrolase family 18 protein [Kiritimatiellae bacterium]|nr:glycosyl hydrolase family 18 protein [Kiritimatiellia bacterium]
MRLCRFPTRVFRFAFALFLAAGAISLASAARVALPDSDEDDNLLAGQDAWDETGPDVEIEEAPDIREVPVGVERARHTMRTMALAQGATEEQAEQAALSVPVDIGEWKSAHQLALEEHRGQAPSDVDTNAVPSRGPPSPIRMVQPKAIAQGKRVLGWHPYWATMDDIKNYQYSNLTTIAYFSYEVNPATGNADSMGSWSSTPVVDYAWSNGVKTVLTATLFGDAATHQFLTTPSAQSNLITKLLVAMTNRTGRAGNGVNIDFEGVGSWSGATTAMSTFMSNLIVRFHAANPNYEVSIALPSVDWYANFAVSNFDRAGLDYAIIMGYDYYYAGSSTPGPVAPLYSSAQWIGASSWCSVDYSLNYYLGKGITPGKLMLGVPYYGRRWAAASTNFGAASLGSGSSAALTYGAAETQAQQKGKRWDNNASVPYYTYTEAGTAYQTFYDDATSLGMKYDLSNSKGLGGIGIWNLTQGSGKTELWNVIYDKFGPDAEEPGEPGGGDGDGGSGSALWTKRTLPHSGNFYGVASRDGLHVASGAGGAIYTSTNGIDWSARSSGKSGLLMNVNGDGPLWVVVGESGAIITSTDGLTWTSRTSPTNALFRGIAYGNGIYLAVGDNGALVRSTNGVAWSVVVSGTANSLQGVAYGKDFVNAGSTNGAPVEPGLFVITGASGLIMTSPDGVSWTPRTSGTSVWLSDVIYGNGYYVSVGNTRILRSSDGITWSATVTEPYFYRVGYCAGVFKAVGTGGAIWTSLNGQSWSAEVSNTTNDLRGVSYANDQFVAVGFSGTILTKGSMAGAGEDGGGGEGPGDGGEIGDGDEPLPTPDDTGLAQVAAAQPSGPLSGVVVFTSAGHGFGANAALTAWIPERGLTQGMNEDMGNVDQLNYFADQAWKLGATLVPFRPIGYQTNEVVLDNMDTNDTPRGQVTFGGTWYNSSQTIYYGKAGDAVPYRYAAVSGSGSTSWASYRPKLPAAGEYPVYTWVRHGSDRTNQLYRIYHTGGITDVRVDHSAVGNGWVWLGNYYFEAGTNGYVNIGNYVPGGKEGSYVFADAIRFGNGMGSTARGSAGISGFEQELESSRFWVIKSMGQGMPNSLYDMEGYDDREDNIGQPARMASYMSRTNDRPRWRRVYVGFHSNASDGNGRGALGLYDTRLSGSYPTQFSSQTNLAWQLGRRVNEDMRAGVTSGDIASWSARTTYLYGSQYGEIYNSSVFLKMDTTIIEVGFHDNATDAGILKASVAREWIARATARGLVQHVSAYYASGIANVKAPDRPVKLRAFNSGAGKVTVSWAMPPANGASGDAPTGFTIYTSTDGRGFGNPISVSGGGATSVTITNLNAGATIFFRVAARNAGGESLDSAVAGVRVTANGVKAGVLVVDGFKRNDSGLTPTRYFANGINGQVALVRRGMINTFDYVKEHGLALAAAGQTFDYLDSTLVTAASALTNYAKVVWILGEESTVDETFSTTEQTAVTTYLNGGGRLLVSGAEIAWDLGRVGTSTQGDLNFFTNTLRTLYGADSSGTGRVTGATSGFLNGVSLTFNYTNLLPKTYAANFPDVLKANSGAVTAAVYGANNSGPSGAVIQYSNATYRTIVMGFPFETITDVGARATVMTKAMQFLGDSSTPGGIRVTLAPAGAASAGRWMVAGTTNTSGSARSGLNPGTYQVTFSSVAGYITPAATSVVVAAGATNVFTVTYPTAAGSLTVTLEPASAVADGRWSVDGGATWRTSGYSLSNLTNGTYTVTFKEISNHATPAPKTVTISGAPVSTSASYTAQVGDLTVTLTPVGARDGGAAWSVDGGTTWYASGATAYGLLAGRQYLTFKAVTGYDVPTTSYTTVNAGTNVNRSYAYSAQPGSISVTLSPPAAVAAGAAWSVDGGTNWNESGATVSDLAAKPYAVSFKNVTGFIPPATINLTLNPGESATLSGAYQEEGAVCENCIVSQGFDGLDAHPWGWSVVFLNNSAQVTTNDPAGAEVAINSDKTLFAANAVRMRGSSSGAINPAIIFTNINISGFTNVTLTVPFAATGVDANDDLYVAVSYDAGVSWAPASFGEKIADGYSNQAF